jgi:hypothetical protein
VAKLVDFRFSAKEFPIWSSNRNWLRNLVANWPLIANRWKNWTVILTRRKIRWLVDLSLNRYALLPCHVKTAKMLKQNLLKRINAPRVQSLVWLYSFSHWILVSFCFGCDFKANKNLL